MKVLVGLLRAALLLFVVSCTGLIANSRVVELVPIALDSRNPEQKHFGKLILMSAFQLKSGDDRFGGLSGLAFGPDNKLYAVSDKGRWLSARMVFHPDGSLVDLADWEIKPLVAPDKTRVAGVLTDSEALARTPDGSFIVAFEQAHRLWRYPPPPANFTSPPVSVPLPPEVTNAPNNGGLEGVAVLPDGRILALTEEFQNADGSFKGWLIDNGRFAELSYTPSGGFRVSDCVALRSGDVIVLERSYTLFGTLRARLKFISRDSIRPGAELNGEEILRLDPPLAVDNFEGVAVQEDPLKGTMIYLVSDDNFHPLQRTLLLQFRLDKSGD
ncbi:MAG: esterase-like activity of phytase family protein [Candidatus Binatia bacterium]